MAAYVMVLFRAKSFYSQAKLLASTGENAAIVSRITLQIDNMIRDYRKDKSEADNILKRVNAVRAELERLKSPSDIGMAFSAGSAQRKLAKHENGHRARQLGKRGT